jgi:AMP-binding enzyme C-terminal domain
MPEAPLIIRGGQAVPPLEVERILLSHPGVAEAAVIGIPDLFWDEIVTAAVRLSAPMWNAPAELAAYCRERLAPYKVPVRWLFTGVMPRTRAGAVCRPTLAVQLGVVSRLDGSQWSAQLPAAVGGASPAAPPASPAPPASLRGIRPRPAIEDLRVPRQVRWSGALDDLDHL